MIRSILSSALASGALAAALFAAPAFAGQPLSVQLQSPVASPVKLVAGGATWTCAGDTCRAGATTDRTLGVDGCRELAKAVGPVASYGAGFDAARLAKCDAGLGAAVVAKTAAPSEVASAR